MARIAYHSSDVILSVQPALDTDSEFSRQLHSLVSKRTPGILCKEPEVNCSATMVGDSLLTQLPGANFTTQCRPSPLCFPAPAVWKASFSHNNFIYITSLDPSPIQTRPFPYSDTCGSSSIWASRLFRYNVHTAVWIHLFAIRDTA